MSPSPISTSTMTPKETKRAVEADWGAGGSTCGGGRQPAILRCRGGSTVKEFKQLDILVNDAAFRSMWSRFEDLTEERFDRTIKTNLYGYFHMAKAAVPGIEQNSAIVMTRSRPASRATSSCSIR